MYWALIWLILQVTMKARAHISVQSEDKSCNCSTLLRRSPPSIHRASKTTWRRRSKMTTKTTFWDQTILVSCFFQSILCHSWCTTSRIWRTNPLTFFSILTAFNSWRSRVVNSMTLASWMMSNSSPSKSFMERTLCLNPIRIEER